MSSHHKVPSLSVPATFQWTGNSILIAGGTGSLGTKLVERILPQKPKRLIIFSRDELKQSEMRQRFPDETGPMRYFIGDVRDKERLLRAFDGVDIVVHAAALKQVPAIEYNPLEAIKTNVLGASNVIDAALDRGVKKILAISTDKACTPANTYGKTKALSESLFVQANAYVGGKEIAFAVCRYGNVVGSRGSVVPLFLKQRETGTLTITDERMTRFWITLDGAVDLIEYSLAHMTGGEIFVPRIPSMRIIDLATAMAPDCEHRLIGIRPGEKLHETLITEAESIHCYQYGDVYIIAPAHPWWTTPPRDGKPVPDGWSYCSDTNAQWLTTPELQRLLHICKEVKA